LRETCLLRERNLGEKLKWGSVKKKKSSITGKGKRGARLYHRHQKAKSVTSSWGERPVGQGRGGTQTQVR